jgi:sulfide dehydrogenase cytochrome subunit
MTLKARGWLASIGLTFFALVAQGQGASAQTTPQAMLYVKSLAASCAACHGTHGKVVEGSQVPSLAGLDKTYLLTQMQAFKAGTRPASVMHQISKGYSDPQIEAMASYFAAQPK